MEAPYPEMNLHFTTDLPKPKFSWLAIVCLIKWALPLQLGHHYYFGVRNRCTAMVSTHSKVPNIFRR